MICRSRTGKAVAVSIVAVLLAGGVVASSVFDSDKNDPSATDNPGLPAPSELSLPAADTDAVGTPARAELRPERELPHRRTATSTVTQHPDGTYTLRQYGAPRFYQTSNGDWAAIDTTLVPDGAVVPGEQATAYKTVANDWRARFAASTSKRGIVELTMGAERVGLVPVGARAVAPELVSKDGVQTVRYLDVWPRVDLEYTVSSYAVKENIVLKDASSVRAATSCATGSMAARGQRVRRRPSTRAIPTPSDLLGPGSFGSRAQEPAASSVTAEWTS